MLPVMHLQQPVMIQGRTLIFINHYKYPLLRCHPTLDNDEYNTSRVSLNTRFQMDPWYGQATINFPRDIARSVKMGDLNMYVLVKMNNRYK